MKNILILINLTTSLVIITSQLLLAQDKTLFNMPYIQQSTLVNPAIQHECKLYIGLPVISNVNFNVAHTGFEYNDIFNKTKSGKYAINLDNLEKKVHNWNYFKTNININILAIGYKYEDYYFSFDITNKTDIKLGYPDDYLKFTHGNGNFLGKNYLQLSPYLNAVNYNEVSLGASKIIDDKLTIGGKIKYLNGTTNAQITNSYFKLFTDEDTYDLKAVGKFEANASFPITITYDTLNIPSNVSINDINIKKDFIFNGNRGASIDLGAIYNFNNDITISTSLLDLGFIRWKKNTNTYQGKGEFTFDGIDISKYISDDIFDNDYNKDSLWEVIKTEYTDSLQKSYNLNNNTSDYYSFLLPKLFAGATYNFSKQLNFGLLTRTALYNRHLYPSITISANSNFWKNHIQATISYSVMNNSYKNLGIGLGFKFVPIQLYAISDNFISAFNPKNNRSFSFQFGINLLFNCNEDDNSKKTIKNYSKNKISKKNKARGFGKKKYKRTKRGNNKCPAYR